jgi:hypothetical protein
MKEEMLQKIKEAMGNPAEGRNSMGCSESNYNPYFMVGNCFGLTEVEKMDENTLDKLLKLAEYAGEVFY